MGAWGHAFHGGASTLCSPWRAHAGAEEKCEEEGAAERNHRVPMDHHPVLFLASLKGLNATCSDRKGEGEESGVKERS